MLPLGNREGVQPRNEPEDLPKATNSTGLRVESLGLLLTTRVFSKVWATFLWLWEAPLVDSTPTRLPFTLTFLQKK